MIALLSKDGYSIQKALRKSLVNNDFVELEKEDGQIERMTTIGVKEIIPEAPYGYLFQNLKDTVKIWINSAGKRFSIAESNKINESLYTAGAGVYEYLNI